MDTLLIVCLTVFLTGTLPLAALGGLIAFKQKRHWVNGVDQSKLANPEAFGAFVGKSIIATGLGFAIVAVLLYARVLDVYVFTGLLFVLGLLPLPCLFIAKRMYQYSSENSH